MTAYWGAGLPEVLGELQDTLAEILKPSLRQEDFDSEKKVILEEIAMYDDQPFWVLYENAMQHYYGDHPLGHRVLGTNQTVQDMQRDSLMEYFTQRYGADNIIVAMAGKLEFEAMVDRIEAHCGAWERTEVARDYTSFTRIGGHFKQAIEDLQQHYLMMVMPSPSFQDERKYAAAALGSILGGGDGSRLHWALVDAGLAEAASASADASDKYGEQLAWAVCDKENAEQVAEIMRNEMDGVVSSLTKDDLDRVVAKAGTGAAIGAERPSGRMQRLGSMVITSNEYISLEEELKHIESLTIKNLNEVAEEFPWEPLLTATTTN
jgi:predicted Zn-dependent peptidase